jgi:hypothetical protein
MVLRLDYVFWQVLDGADDPERRPEPDAKSPTGTLAMQNHPLKTLSCILKRQCGKMKTVGSWPQRQRSI